MRIHVPGLPEQSATDQGGGLTPQKGTMRFMMSELRTELTLVWLPRAPKLGPQVCIVLICVRQTYRGRDFLVSGLLMADSPLAVPASNLDPGEGGARS